LSAEVSVSGSCGFVRRVGVGLLIPARERFNGLAVQSKLPKTAKMENSK
jgi:hypothetical protein